MPAPAALLGLGASLALGAGLAAWILLGPALVVDLAWLGCF
jgi:hypothetical protein